MSNLSTVVQEKVVWKLLLFYGLEMLCNLSVQLRGVYSEAQIIVRGQVFICYRERVRPRRRNAVSVLAPESPEIP